MKKVIFLDFDGVLNNNQQLNEFTRGRVPVQMRTRQAIGFDPINIKALKELIDEDTAIVVTSVWRIKHTVEELRQLFKNSRILMEAVKDKTVVLPKHTPSTRSYEMKGEEIQIWLDKYNPEKYVIIDDNIIPLDTNKAKCFIKTDPDYGLTINNVEQAKEILEK